LFSLLIEIGAAAVGLVAALLPARLWERFPRLPIARMMLLSAALTSAIGTISGAVGFLAYGRHTADRANRVTLNLAERQARGELTAGGDITTATPVVVSALSVVAFTFLTPLGLISLYMVGSGLFRVASNVVGEERGDPVLTGLDALAVTMRRSRIEKKTRRDRERREGPDVPDRLFPGSWAGLPKMDYVVVSSRRKPDWTRGTFVITPERWYRLGEPFELELPIGLRTVYPLKAQTAFEVLRRGVVYDLPPLEPVTKRPA
jgi:hypothetical protein